MQGPPGTGKVSRLTADEADGQTFTGVELLRLLIENNTGYALRRHDTLL